MPSLATFADFDALLATARAEVAAMHTGEPDDDAIESVRRQLDALHAWTPGGRCPDQAGKDRLNFGMIASRELDTYPVAGSLYALASFVTYWGEEGGAPR